ncbi:MAG: hypothetical protein JWO82_3941, partial [Akkermansiaceae bacterium]|nr:hypothetical protein [Akkermansiaceae bacterium]
MAGMKSRLPALLLSHGAALLAGCAAFAAWGKFHPRPHPAGAHDSAPPPSPSRPPAPEKARAAAVAQVLASLPGQADQPAAEAKRRSDFQQEVRREIARMQTKPENLQAELAAAVQAATSDAAEQNWQPGQGSPRVAALLYFWGLDSLGQVLTALSPWQRDAATEAALQAALVELYAVLGRDAMVAELKTIGAAPVLKLIVADLLQSPDLAAISQIKGQVDESCWTQLLMGLREDWPFSRRDELLKLLIREDRSEILLNGGSRGPEWNAW